MRISLRQIAKVNASLHANLAPATWSWTRIYSSQSMDTEYRTPYVNKNSRLENAIPLLCVYECETILAYVNC